MTQASMNETASADTEESFSEQYFRKLIGRMQKTVAKVRRIDVAELLELAWVDGMLEPFAERLIRSRPELKEDVESVCQELRIAD
ncbi:MAG: hypothetical protein NTX25_13740 [Proteobacteria bacterium]|nr:hypothetical protein [Pseudomonadota bacterium]